MSITEIFESMEYGPAPEGAQPGFDWLDGHGRKFGLFIDGAFVEASAHFASVNPANGQELAQIAQANAADVDRAVAAAKAAQTGWAALSGHERARCLYAIARQIQKHSRLFAVLETLDNGKPIRETRDIDIPLVARHFYHHAGWAQLLDREFPNYKPVGVCGQIIPWNFPLLMLAWKIAPALAAGNAVVLKPAEFTSLTALLFAEICVEAGLPKGVVNIVTGDGETGRLLVAHPDVDKIAFTGSTEVGRLIRQATADTPKKLSLELGGKSPFIVFEDADLDSSVEGLVDAIWFNQGQVCCAGSRLLVQESVAAKVYEKVRRRMENLRVGDPLDKAVDIGAIVDQIQLDRIGELVAQGVSEGATLFQPPQWTCPREGWFYPPTLLTDVEPASTVAQVEIFGPVLVAMTFRTPAEAVALANNTPYGLAASVWTENISLAHDVAAKVKAGTVWVNCTNQFDAASGFGGYRESGFGREGGREGLYEYLKLEPAPVKDSPAPARERSDLDTTQKLYIGGKQVRPDGGYSFTVDGQEYALANRKDVRNAVEAAAAAQPAWAAQSGHLRAQILYYLAENLGACTESLFDFAALADKYDGQVHGTPFKGLTYTLNEPVGVIGIVLPDERPLEALVEAIAAAISMGNTVVVVPSRKNPEPACHLYRVLDASDVPAGVVNILTGEPEELATVLADHDGVDAVWCFREATDVKRRSAGNLKQIWAPANAPGNMVREWVRHATQVKNVWVPMGD